MPSPSNILEFLDLTLRSDLLERRSLDTYLTKLANEQEQPNTAKQLAQAMVRDGVLTALQAGLLLKGKWRNFIINGKFKLLEHLGTGGMGSVYLCEHVLMRRRVALKVLPNDKVSDPMLLDRFYREARAVAALDHHNIVRAHDIDCDGDLHFMVLEYVDGSSLQTIIDRFGPMSIARAVNCIRQTADGLQHAHEAGLVHRDIKPGNLLVDRCGIVKILDLGLARFFGDEAGPVTRQYELDNVVGTADYLAPEQAVADGCVDIRGDIYSLGVTFYFLLTGRSPYQDGSVSQKLMFHQLSAPTPITEYRRDVPRRLAVVIEKMLAKDPEQRFQTPAELADALAPWDEGPQAPGEEEMPRLSPAARSSQSTNTLPQMPTMRINAPVKSEAAPFWVHWRERLQGLSRRNPRVQAVLMIGIVTVAAICGAAAAVLAAH
ncbi:MAG TPA: serine/threonine-protein kinase [Gemmataceae bacterium]|nr:serine/threonine-protein kinase [Gemmataceae bacterium]